MATKVKELQANPLRRNGNKANCMLCTPRDDRVPHDRAWRWSLEHKQFPLKDGVEV